MCTAVPQLHISFCFLYSRGRHMASNVIVIGYNLFIKHIKICILCNINGLALPYHCYIELTARIQNAACVSTPKIKRKGGEKIYAKAIKAMVKQKRKIRRRCQQPRNPETQAQLNIITKKLSFEIKMKNNDAISRT